MSWWTRKIPSVTTEPEDERKLKTEGLWEKCDGCGQIIWKKELEENLSVCTQCGFHFKLNAEERLSLLFDDGQWQELDSTLRSTDPLHFVDSKPYASRMAAMASSALSCRPSPRACAMCKARS